MYSVLRFSLPNGPPEELLAVREVVRGLDPAGVSSPTARRPHFSIEVCAGSSWAAHSARATALLWALGPAIARLDASGGGVVLDLALGPDDLVGRMMTCVPFSTDLLAALHEAGVALEITVYPGERETAARHDV